MSKDLTPKQRDYVKYRAQGVGGIDAVMRAYNCKTRESASVINGRLNKNKKVLDELGQIKQVFRKNVVNKEVKFIDILREYAPPVEVAKRLAELIFESDKRTSDSAIEKYLRLSAEYPDTKQTLTIQLEKERESVLTPADVVKLTAQKQLEEEKEEIETAETKE